MARFVKTTSNINEQTLTFTVTGLDPVVLHLDRVNPSNKTRAMYHGFNQRCADNAADEKTPAGKRAAIAAMVEFYEAGGAAWERERTGGGPRPFDSGAVIAGMARALFAGDVDKANRAAEAVAGKRSISRDEALKLFAQDERVAVEMAKAKAAKITPVLDVDAELAALDDGEPTDAELEALTQPGA